MRQILKRIFCSALLVCAIILAACIEPSVHSEAEAARLAASKFEEYMTRKGIPPSQFKKPLIRYNKSLEGWEVHYDWAGNPEKRNDIVILVDKFGRVEFFTEQP